MEEGIPGKTTRPWRVVAAEVTKKQDPTKLTKLVEELSRALEEQGAAKSGGAASKRSPTHACGSPEQALYLGVTREQESR